MKLGIVLWLVIVALVITAFVTLSGPRTEAWSPGDVWTVSGPAPTVAGGTAVAGSSRYGGYLNGSAAGVTTFTVTFPNPFTNIPACVAFVNNTAATTAYFSNQSSNYFTVVASAGLAATGKVNYQCIGVNE